MKTKPTILNSNENISFPIGTVVTVKKYSSKLCFEEIFGKYKKRGRSLVKLLEALLSYRLSENHSTTKASDWINRDDVLEEFGLKSFEQRTLFRVIEALGNNYEEIICSIQEVLFSQYDFEHTDVNMDWSSLILWGDKSPLGNYGYSRDHRPDKKQVTFGVAEIANPVNIPIGLTINSGNLNDQKHFEKTFNQVKSRLKEKSLLTFDKGANSKDNLALVEASKMKYLTANKFNKSDDKRIEKFEKSKATLIDSEQGMYGIKFEFPSRTDYFYFSERLELEQTQAKLRKVKRKVEEAKQIQLSIENRKELPKRFRIDNPLVDVTYQYQTKLVELDESKAFELVKKRVLNGREGFFCLTSSENLTLKEALLLYRKKDSIEKIMHSLKNEVDIKPLRVWSEKSIYGAILVGYLAQLIISLIRYDNEKLKKVSTKFIKISLMNLTVTVEKLKSGRNRRIYSNFDSINELTLLQNYGIT